jgi:hypothetical protein
MSHPSSRRTAANNTLLETNVDKYSTVVVDKNRYSVPVSYAWLKVRVELSIDGVDIFHDGRRIAHHERLFGNNKWQLDPSITWNGKTQARAFDSALSSAGGVKSGRRASRSSSHGSGRSRGTHRDKGLHIGAHALQGLPA